MPTSMLWKLQGATPDTFRNAGAFATALRQHLRYTPTGLLSVLLQIGKEQSAYLVEHGCAGCALGAPAGGYCVPGCRVELLRRVLSVGYADSELSLIRRGLLPRPYTRAVIAWPAGGQARPLDASVLQGWQHACLALHWRARSHGQPNLLASAVLCVGDGADDPLQRLRAIGWQGRAVPSHFPWPWRHPQAAPRWSARAWLGDPYVLTPLAAAAHWLMHSPIGRSPAWEAGQAAGYDNAAAMVQHLHEAGARVEMLDLDPDGWTARVAATTASGGSPRPIWEALRAPGAPLEVRDAERGVLGLDPAQTRPSGAPPPLLQLGAGRDGRRRWRPLSGTHHLVLAGPIEGGVILGMAGPAAQGRPDLRVGVLDLTATGTLDLALIALPARLPVADGRSVTELLGAVGGLPDTDQPVLVVLAADDAAAAEQALVPCLRAALYRPISVLLVLPTRAAIPALLRERCPVVEVRQRVAQWQVPEGAWDWAQPTVLRLPWRDPQLSWPQLPTRGGQRVASLPPLEGYWAVPASLHHALAPAAGASAALEVPASPDLPALPLPAAPEPGKRVFARSRIYAVPAPASIASDDTSAGARRSRRVPEPLPPVPANGASGKAAPAREPVPEPGELLPTLPGAATTDAGARGYTPREDSGGNLVVDVQLLALTLQWAAGIDPDNQGVSITRFKSGIGLPSKAHSFQLRDALRLHGLIRRDLKKEGWYRLLTVEEAVRSGKLPSGPWYTPAAEERALKSGADAEPADVPASTTDREVSPAVDQATVDAEVAA